VIVCFRVSIIVASYGALYDTTPCDFQQSIFPVNFGAVQSLTTTLCRCFSKRILYSATADAVVESVTGQLADTPTRGLDNSRMSPVVVVVLSA